MQSVKLKMKMKKRPTSLQKSVCIYCLYDISHSRVGAMYYARKAKVMLAASHKTTQTVLEDLWRGIGVSIIPG